MDPPLWDPTDGWALLAGSFTLARKGTFTKRDSLTPAAPMASCVEDQRGRSSLIGYNYQWSMDGG
jgi:hypothetical protein